MAALDWYGIGALVLIVLAFVLVRNIAVYLVAAGVVTTGFALATYSGVDWRRPSEWVVLTAGLLACSFGLLIVRVMLVRSVSLKLLATIDGSPGGSFGENIGGRLHDMRASRLIRTTAEQNSLTPFGQLLSALVALLYGVFRIET
jgi:hypothetical protein